MSNNHFGILFPPQIQKFTTYLSGGTVSGISTKQYTLGTFTAPREGYYTVNMEGVITSASGLNNNNIHIIVSQITTPDPAKLDQFAFQAMPEWNNGTTVLAVSLMDIVKITGTAPVTVYLYDTQAGGSETYDFVFSDVKMSPVFVF
jgi:hypothetical protein